MPNGLADIFISSSLKLKILSAVILGWKISYSTTISRMKRLLELTRYAVVIPSFAAILGALLLMVQGSVEMVAVVIESISDQTTLKDVIVDVLTAIDAILLGTVLLVIGFGLY